MADEGEYGTIFAETEALLAIIIDGDPRKMAAIMAEMSSTALLKLRTAPQVVEGRAHAAGVAAVLMESNTGSPWARMGKYNEFVEWQNQLAETLGKIEAENAG